MNPPRASSNLGVVLGALEQSLPPWFTLIWWGLRLHGSTCKTAFPKPQKSWKEVWKRWKLGPTYLHFSPLSPFLSSFSYHSPSLERGSYHLQSTSSKVHYLRQVSPSWAKAGSSLIWTGKSPPQLNSVADTCLSHCLVSVCIWKIIGLLSWPPRRWMHWTGQD